MYPSEDDVAEHRTNWKWLLISLAAAAVLMIGVTLATAEPVECKPGQSIAEIQTQANDLVASGILEEVVTLTGDSAVNYAKAMNARMASNNYPTSGMTFVVVVAKNKAARVLGFVDGCLAGSGNLLPGTHQRVYGKGT